MVSGFVKVLVCVVIPHAAVLLWHWQGVAMICDGLQTQANKRTHKQSIKQANSQTIKKQTHKQTHKNKH
jgi:hypothetical protein